jgi:hypothetical protein
MSRILVTAAAAIHDFLRSHNIDIDKVEVILRVNDPTWANRVRAAIKIEMDNEMMSFTKPVNLRRGIFPLEIYGMKIDVETKKDAPGP